MGNYQTSLEEMLREVSELMKNATSDIQYEIFNITRDGNITKFVSSRQDAGATISGKK